MFTNTKTFHFIDANKHDQNTRKKISDLFKENYTRDFEPFTEEKLGIQDISKHDYINKIVEDGMKLWDEGLVSCRLCLHNQEILAVAVYGQDPDDKNIVLLDLQVASKYIKQEPEISNQIIEDLERLYPDAPTMQTHVRQIAENEQALYQDKLGFNKIDKDIKSTAYKQKIFSWPGSYIAYEHPSKQHQLNMSRH